MKKQILILSLIFLGYSTQGVSAPPIGKAIELNGKTNELKYARQMGSSSLAPNMPLYYEDEVFTGPQSTTRLVVDDFTANIKGAFYVYEDSKFTLVKEIVEATGKKIVVRLTQGKLNALIKGLQKNDALQIETPYGTVEVKGTCVQVQIQKSGVAVAANGAVTAPVPSGSGLDNAQCEKNNQALNALPARSAIHTSAPASNCP